MHADNARLGAWQLGIRDRDAEIRYRVIQQISDCGDQATSRLGVPVLLDGLTSMDAETHRRALFALAKLAPDSDAVLERLVRIWNDGYPINCWALAELAMGAGLKGARLVPILLPMLDEANRSYSGFHHEPLVRALGRLGPAAPPAALSRLEGALYCRHADERVPYAAASALANIGPAGLPYLLSAACDENCPDHVRWHVIETLGTLPDLAYQIVPVLKSLVATKQWSTLAMCSLAQLGSAAQSTAGMLLRIANDEAEDRQSRAAAANAVWRICGKPYLVLPTLLALLDRHGRAASLAILLPALAGIGPAAVEATPRLRALLGDVELPEQHRMLVAVTLWRVAGSREGQAEIERLLREQSIVGLPEVYAWAAEAISTGPGRG